MMIMMMMMNSTAINLIKSVFYYHFNLIIIKFNEIHLENLVNRFARYLIYNE